MREALRQLCLWWVCLVAAARVAAPDVVTTAAEGGVKEMKDEGVCEVLDLSKKPPGYLLPLNITIKPSRVSWQLDFTLGQGKTLPVCVRLEDKQARMRIQVKMINCEEGDVEGYSYLNVSTPTGVWTSLRVDVADDAVIVSTLDGINTSVVTNGPSLPRDGSQLVLNKTRNLDVAVGCRISCPGYRHASPKNDKKVTVKTWSDDSGHFYVRTGKDFVKLEYEAACTSSVGPEFTRVADLMPDQDLLRNQWHLVQLQHRDGQVMVNLDHKLLKNKTMPSSCTFTRHTIRVMGDGLFSFTCNPFNGNVECAGGAGISVYQADAQAGLIANIVWAIVVVGLLLVIFFLWRNLRQLRNNSIKGETNMDINKTNNDKTATNENNCNTTTNSTNNNPQQNQENQEIPSNAERKSEDEDNTSNTQQQSQEKKTPATVKTQDKNKAITKQHPTQPK